jgi:clathrin heavy chain
MITKYGYVHIFDVETGFSIYTVRISTDTVFITAEYTLNNGVLGINRNGQVNLKKNLIDFLN